MLMAKVNYSAIFKLSGHSIYSPPPCYCLDYYSQNFLLQLFKFLVSLMKLSQNANLWPGHLRNGN